MTADLDQAARGLLLFLFDVSIRALVIAALALVLLALTRPRPGARLAAWSAVLYALLALPGAGLALGAIGWTIPIVPDLWTPTAPAVSALDVLPFTAADSVAASDAFPTSIVNPPLSWWLVAAAVYLGGALLLLARLAVGWALTRGLRHRARAIADSSTLARARELAAARGMRRPPRIAEADRLLVPVTMSVVRPVVLLPSDWREWAPETLGAVLAHEVAHAARRDALTQRLSLIYRAITWPSPLGWWLHRRLADLAEQSSDEAALEAGASRTTYARVLVDFLARVQHAPRRAGWHVAMARRADAGAERRVDRILNWKGGPPMSHTRLAVFGLVFAAAPVVALTAAIVPAAPSPALTERPTLSAPNAAPEPLQAAKPRDVRQRKAVPPRAPVVLLSQQTKVGPVLLGLAPRREGAPATIVRATSNAADGGYASIVVRNDGSTPIRSVVVAASVRPVGQPNAEPRVFTSPALVTWIPPAETRTLEPRLIDPGSLATIGAAHPQGANAVLDLVRVELSDGSVWTPSGGAPVAQLPDPPERSDPFLAGAYPMNTPGLTIPNAIDRPHPKYTADAMRAKIQGTVHVEAVIQPDGTVGRARVVKSLDQAFGLDDQALLAAEQWRFTPATLYGQPVATVATLVLEFKLH